MSCESWNKGVHLILILFITVDGINIFVGLEAFNVSTTIMLSYSHFVKISSANFRIIVY